MTVLVNYYTCSYGDSFINMFNGNPVLRQNGIAKCNFSTFIEPDFYVKDVETQKQHWAQCQKLKFRAVPCHRQNSYDFLNFFEEPIKVITIVLDEINFLAPRFKRIHLERRKKSINNSTLAQMLDLYPTKHKEIITQDYNKWITHNMLATDIEFRFSWLRDQQKTQNFCNTHNLEFDQSWVENILQDVEQYALL